MTDVATFVRAHLAPPPVRVLEIGAGDGSLARELRGLDYDVVAIDPEPGNDDVLAVALADLDEPAESFDAAVAVLSLHHVEPLEPSCRRLAQVVRRRGRLVIDEFDIASYDERAAAWLAEQRELLRKPTPGDLEDLHPIERIVNVLEQWFDFGPLEPVSYLYRWDLGDALRPREEQLIAEGVLPATGARVVGTRR